MSNEGKSIDIATYIEGCKTGTIVNELAITRSFSVGRGLSFRALEDFIDGAEGCLKSVVGSH